MNAEARAVIAASFHPTGLPPPLVILAVFALIALIVIGLIAVVRKIRGR